MIYELNHVGAFVRDGDATVDFYERILGGKVVREALIPATNTRCIYVQIAGGVIEFLAASDSSTRSHFGLDHVAFMTDDLDADHQRLADAGFSFSVTPKMAGSGVGRLAFLSDPNGVRIELIERDDTYKQPSIEGRIKSFDHISLLARDLASAEAFYGEFIGMSMLKRMRVDARDLNMVYLNMGDDVVELLQPAQLPQGAPLIGHIALRVDSVDAMVEELQGKDVTFDASSPKAAGTGLGRIAVFTDPDGIKIELLDRPDLRNL